MMRGAAAMRPLFGFLLALYTLTASGHLYLGDAWSMVRTAEALVTRGELAIPFEDGFGGKHGADGKFYAKYPPGVLAHMLVPAAAGHALARASSDANVRKVLTGLPPSFVNAPFAALIATLFFGIGLRLGYGPRAAVGATLALACGTVLWPYAKHDAFEAQMTAPLMLALYLILSDSPRAALHAGLAFGWAMLAKPVAVLALPGLAWVAWRRRPAPATAFAFAAGPALALAAILAYNALRYGNPLETGYSTAVQAYAIPFLMGLFGLLFSAGKGVLWYSPALAFAGAGASRFGKRHPDVFAMALGTFAIHLVFYSIQQNWDGDWCWGPRYLVPCVPFLMLLALPLFEEPPEGWRRLALGAIGGLAVGVQVLGVAIDPSDYPRMLSAHKAAMGDFLKKPEKVYVPLHPHHFNPDFSPLRGHLYLLSCTIAQRIGARPAPMMIYSSIEEHNDRAGHRLEPVLTLPVDETRLGLDMWLPLFSGIASGSTLAQLAIWCAFAFDALALVYFRRRVWRAIRQAEATP
jgi:hypothetical protein